MQDYKQDNYVAARLAERILWVRLMETFSFSDGGLK